MKLVLRVSGERPSSYARKHREQIQDDDTRLETEPSQFPAERESVLFIGTQFSILYTFMYWVGDPKVNTDVLLNS
jgi:hypothetical protein